MSEVSPVLSDTSTAGSTKKVLSTIKIIKHRNLAYQGFHINTLLVIKINANENSH